MRILVNLRKSYRSRNNVNYRRALVVFFLVLTVAIFLIHPRQRPNPPPATLIASLDACIPQGAHITKVLSEAGKGYGTYYYVTISGTSEAEILIWRDKSGCVPLSSPLPLGSKNLLPNYVDEGTAQTLSRSTP